MSGKDRRWDIQWLCRLISIAGWKSDGEIEWEIDERNGRLVIKGRGPLEDYADGSKSSRMKAIQLISGCERYKGQIKSVVVYHGVSSISDATFCG